MVPTKINKSIMSEFFIYLFYSQNTMWSPVDSLIQISIIEYDIRALASQLKCDRFQIGFSSCFHDFTSNDGATGEGNFSNLHVRWNGSAGGGSISGDDVDDTSGEAGFFDKGTQADGGQGGELGRLYKKDDWVKKENREGNWKRETAHLQDDSISCSDSRSNLPCPHEDCFFYEREKIRKRLNSFLHYRFFKKQILRGKFPVIVIMRQSRMDQSSTKLTWNDLAYDSDGFMTGVYQFSFVSLIQNPKKKKLAKEDRKQINKFRPRWIGQWSCQPIQRNTWQLKWRN